MKVQINPLPVDTEEHLKSLGFLPRANSDPNFALRVLLDGLNPPAELLLPVNTFSPNLAAMLRFAQQKGYMDGYRAGKKEAADAIKNQVDVAIFGSLYDPCDAAHY